MFCLIIAYTQLNNKLYCITCLMIFILNHGVNQHITPELMQNYFYYTLTGTAFT